MNELIPIPRFWKQPTQSELMESNARLKSMLLMAVAVAAIGWGVAVYFLVSLMP